MAGTDAQGFERYQDVLGQMTFLKTYTHIVLGFRPNSSVAVITTELERAAKKLVEAFPWIGGHVVRQGKGPGKTGLATIVPYAPGDRPTPLVVKDVTGLCSSLDAIISAGVPMAALDGEVLAVRKGLPDVYDEAVEPAPVLIIQANIVEGGLILAFQGNHSTMDMNGMGQIIRLYGKALRSEPFSNVEIEQGNRDRRNVIKLLGPDDEKVDISKYRVRPPPANASPTSVPQPSLHWVYFHFSGPKLAELKAIASGPSVGDPGEPSLQWVSTDDALFALICQRVTAARVKRMEKKQQVIFCRAVNGRRFVEPPIPKEYMGHLVTCVYTTAPLDSSSATDDLPELARRMRVDLLSTQSLEIQSLATALDESDDKGSISYGSPLDMSDWDLMISSFSGLGLNQTDFGSVLGGRPLFSKRPRFTPLESLMYFMPKTSEGDVDVACCLRTEDIESLRGDEKFLKYAQYVG
ncbi:hypothetical protein VMCG_05978 [Cytospora schulzeri]|uniref:Trichothecene 3-O-acetyltransferase-like N-terminal domain-containing protein n=1 Tax=Cytospora schulzeri TaxID=448051 RepID=A0A423WDA8_9PEZI|nr:hypothetical protein VMCG_05978 [Valsa malicola]